MAYFLSTFLSISLFFLSFPSLTIQCQDASSWQNRTIYQVLTDRFSTDTGTGGTCSDDLTQTYCGGTFLGLQRRLDYIQAMGFDAIWISPITDVAPGAYHGYWPRRLYEINAQFSVTADAAKSEQDLKNLVDAAHARGIWVMLDTVPNHMGGPSIPVSGNFSEFSPFDQSTHYNQKVCETPLCGGKEDCLCCIPGEAFNITATCQDLNTEAVTECRVAGGLLDLNQSNPFVGNELVKWLQWVTEKFGFDGVRVDSAKSMPVDFLRKFREATNCYNLGEVFPGGGLEDRNPCYMARFQIQEAMDAPFSYPLALTLRNVFALGAPLTDILAMRKLYKEAGFPRTDILALFLDNHDVDRFSSLNSDPRALRSALVYLLFSEGIPVVYYGTEQAYNGTLDDNTNRAPLWFSGAFSKPASERPLYEFLAQIVALRKDLQVWNYPHEDSETTSSFHAFTRGPILVALTNTRDQVVQKIGSFSHNYLPGQRLCNVLYPADCVLVDLKGSLEIVLEDGEQKIFSP